MIKVFTYISSLSKHLMKGYLLISLVLIIGLTVFQMLERRLLSDKLQVDSVVTINNFQVHSAKSEYDLNATVWTPRVASHDIYIVENDETRLVAWKEAAKYFLKKFKGTNFHYSPYGVRMLGSAQFFSRSAIPLSSLSLVIVLEQIGVGSFPFDPKPIEDIISKGCEIRSRKRSIGNHNCSCELIFSVCCDFHSEGRFPRIYCKLSMPITPDSLFIELGGDVEIPIEQIHKSENQPGGLHVCLQNIAYDQDDWGKLLPNSFVKQGLFSTRVL